MNIWINSCHAALEYDQAKTFSALGHNVNGLFDVGSTQRPKVIGVTDVDAPGPIHEANKTRSIMVADIGNPDVVVVHQAADFPARVCAYAKQKVQTVAVIFGQGNNAQHMELAAISRDYPNVWIVPYALKEFNLYTRMHANAARLRLIRFGKTLDEFDPDTWRGDEPVCFVPCNSIHQRGDGCNWDAVQLLLGAGIPLTLSGKDTEEVGGKGELTFDEYREWMKRAYCYLHVGTIPAPYTLTLVEAACSGTPIVALDNGFGLAGENFGIKTAVNAEAAARHIREIINDEVVRRNGHDHAAYLARILFSGETMNRAWGDLLNNIERAIND